MAFKFFDRVKEKSATVGTGNIALAGAVTQFRAFQSCFEIDDSFYYAIADQNQSGGNWEVGVGTLVGANTLERTSVLASSNAGALVNFTSAALFVWNDFPANACELAEIKAAPVITEVLNIYKVVLVLDDGTIALATVEDVLNASGIQDVIGDASGNILGDASGNQLGGN